MRIAKTNFFRYKRECHNCTRNAHRLIITKRFGTVCRKCYKKGFSFLVELFNNLVGHCKSFVAIYTEKEFCDCITDLDSVLNGIKIVWEQVYGAYYGTHRNELEEIYRNTTKNENACLNILK